MDGFKTSQKMQCFKEGGAVKYKSRHSEKSEMSEDIAQDKKVVKKAFAMHDKQSHEGDKTNLSKLKKGGRMKKEGGCVGRYKDGGTIKTKVAKTKKAKAPSKAAIKPAMSNIAEPAPDMGAMPPMMKKGGNVKKYNMGGMASYDQAMQDPKAKKMMRDASIARTLKANPISETELSSISDSGPAKGLRNYGRMYKQGLGMKPETAYEYKKGGKAKKCAEGGSLKSVDAEENPGLAKLPTNVRNKMGYAKKGGNVKKYADGGIVDNIKSVGKKAYENVMGTEAQNKAAAEQEKRIAEKDPSSYEAKYRKLTGKKEGGKACQ